MISLLQADLSVESNSLDQTNITPWENMFFVIKKTLSSVADELQRTGLFFSLTFSPAKEDYSSMITGIPSLK